MKPSQRELMLVHPATGRGMLKDRLLVNLSGRERGKEDVLFSFPFCPPFSLNLEISPHPTIVMLPSDSAFAKGL
jgi:hypothetical protein